jgi:RimJ/RimL family protein N-acetyltransferase
MPPPSSAQPPTTPGLRLRRLAAGDEADVRELQRVLQAAPGYSLAVEGRLPPAQAARALFEALPPGKEHADKFVLGFEDATGSLVGCADLIRGYPEPQVAFIGLLLFAETSQGRGPGPAALRQLETKARGWGCPALRLAVIETNPRALAFLQRAGIVERLRKPSPGHTGAAIVMERPL